MPDRASAVETDVLIVGTGPAGSSAAALLSTYGVPNMLVNKYGWTARTPRAHITNQRTMEVLRDLGLESEAVNLAAPADLMGENTYCTSLAGEELGRIKTWGTHPNRRADYELASPTSMCDLPQNLLEPILVRAAAHRGSKVRFDTEYLHMEQDDQGVTSTLLDRITGQEFTVRSRYLIGADGANSKIVDDAAMPVEGKMGLSGSINMVFEADLSKYVAYRPSVLYWVIQPGSDVGGLGIGVVRMVRPWHRWLAIWGYDVDDGPPEMTNELATQIVHKLIGDDTVPVKIDATSTWTVNNAYVTRNINGRVFCMGDATHRHPPTNGLGSNTSIQDAFNLAWKMALVLGGKAAPELLETYDTERSPVAEQIVKRANKSLGDFPPILQALGLFDTKDPVQMQKNMAARKDSTSEAAEQRAALIKAIDSTHYVYNAHGVEMNMRYASTAVVPDGTPDPGFKRDAELYHEHSSRPGAPIPHAWLQHGSEKVSTLDLCGGGRFSLVTGTGGEAWVDAAADVSAKLGVPISAAVIGPGKAFEDPYGDWARIREIDENGALLVRPDFIVGWRSHSLPADAERQLLKAMQQVLGTAE
ncbi:MAG: FAD-dependent monooxygenase [Pseudomonadota bacterium]